MSKLLLSIQHGLNPLGPLRQQNDSSVVGQINLTRLDIKIDHGYCDPKNLTQLGTKTNFIQVVGQINLTNFIYLTLSNKNQLVPYGDSVYILFFAYSRTFNGYKSSTQYISHFISQRWIISTAFEFLKQIYLILLAFMGEVGGNLNYIFKALPLLLIILITSFSSFFKYHLWIRNKIFPLNQQLFFPSYQMKHTITLQ